MCYVEIVCDSDIERETMMKQFHVSDQQTQCTLPVITLATLKLWLTTYSYKVFVFNNERVPK